MGPGAPAGADAVTDAGQGLLTQSGRADAEGARAAAAAPPAPPPSPARTHQAAVSLEIITRWQAGRRASPGLVNLPASGARCGGGLGAERPALSWGDD